MRDRRIAVLSAAVAVHAVLCAAPLLAVHGGLATLVEPQVIAVLLLLSAWVAGEAMAQPRGVAGTRPACRPDALPLAILLAVWASLAERAVAGGTTWWPWAAAGLAGIAAGIGLRIAAIRALGDRFLDGVELLPWHRLERGGVYGVLRHPAEAGNVLIAAGCAGAMGSATGAVVALGVVGPLAVWRMHREEVLLRPVLQRRPVRT